MASGEDTLLDALLFSGNVNPVKDVMVAGVWRVRDGHHPAEARALAGYAAATRALLGS